MVQRKSVGSEPSDERRAVVLLEELKPQVKLILEGQTGLVDRMGRLERRVEENYSELHKLMMNGFEKVYKDVGDIDAQFAGVNARLDTLTSRFDAHERAHTG